MYYTIGQRIGSRLGFDIKKEKGGSVKKWYVAKKNKNNTIVVAPGGHNILKIKQIKIKSIHLINPKESIPNKLKVRIRHLGKFNSGVLKKKGNIYTFTFKKPLEGIAEGQSAVFYSGSKIIGGGEIRL